MNWSVRSHSSRSVSRSGTSIGKLLSDRGLKGGTLWSDGRFFQPLQCWVFRGSRALVQISSEEIVAHYSVTLLYSVTNKGKKNSSFLIMFAAPISIFVRGVWEHSSFSTSALGRPRHVGFHFLLSLNLHHDPVCEQWCLKVNERDSSFRGMGFSWPTLLLMGVR